MIITVGCTELHDLLFNMWQLNMGMVTLFSPLRELIYVMSFVIAADFEALAATQFPIRCPNNRNTSSRALADPVSI